MSEGMVMTQNMGDAAEAKKWATIVYLLQALSFLVGITAIAGVIINYIKRDDVRGTVAESHFNWQIKTFWWSLAWAVLGMISLSIFIGAFILLANTIWVIYRIIKGWLRLNDNKPV